MTIYNAVFRIDQTREGGTSVGEPGISRRDLWLSNVVHLVPTSPPPDATFLWEFLDRPSGSAAVFLDETTGQESATSKYVKFTPDVWGTYRIRLTINRGQYSQVELAAALLSSTGGVTHRGWRLPSFKEIDTEANFPGQLRGYADDWDFILMDILEHAFAGGGGSVTLGGDLAEWSPDPNPSKQRVVGLNEIPLPASPPVDRNILVVRADDGGVRYQFTKKNIDRVRQGGSSIYVGVDDEVVACQSGDVVYLPSAPIDGERHVIVDAGGGAKWDPVVVNYWVGGEAGYDNLTKIKTNYGAVTVVYSANSSRWLEV
jgi:hypothetical protein